MVKFNKIFKRVDERGNFLSVHSYIPNPAAIYNVEKVYNAIVNAIINDFNIRHDIPIKVIVKRENNAAVTQLLVDGDNICAVYRNGNVAGIAFDTHFFLTTVTIAIEKRFVESLKL